MNRLLPRLDRYQHRDSLLGAPAAFLQIPHTSGARGIDNRRTLTRARTSPATPARPCTAPGEHQELPRTTSQLFTPTSFPLQRPGHYNTQSQRLQRFQNQHRLYHLFAREIKHSGPGVSGVLVNPYHTTMSKRSPSPPSATTLDPSFTAIDEGNPSSGEKTPRRPRFPVSPIPPNKLGEGKCVRTAAALIIGDEILNGKTLDSNSHVFAQFCFEHGIDLKRIEVIPDDENEIIEASRRLVSKFDLVVTSGGIGPTHDDITYESLGKAFNMPLVHHEETIRRMSIMNQHRKWVRLQTDEQRTATYRMALFPAGAEVLFVDEEIWVPVVRLEGKLCIFPGVPALFQKMLHSLAAFLPLPPKQERPLRIQIFTERPESIIAPYLTQLQERLRPHGIQVGSYPVLYKGVFVSLIGRDLAPPSPPSSPSTSPEPSSSSHQHKQGKQASTRIWLADVAREVEREVGGRVLSEEEVAEQKREAAGGAPVVKWGQTRGRKETGQLEDSPAEMETEGGEAAKSNLTTGGGGSSEPLKARF